MLMLNKMDLKEKSVFKTSRKYMINKTSFTRNI